MPKINATKLAQMLACFSKEELKSFEIWLKSPWFNTNKNLPKLIAELSKFHPTFESKHLNKEKLFARVLPKGKYSDRRFNNLFSDAYLAAEQFLIYHRLQVQEDLQEDLLTRELQEKYLEDWFFKRVDEASRNLETRNKKKWTDHLQMYRYHSRVYAHPGSKTRAKGGGELLYKMNEELDTLYLLEKAYLLNEMFFRKRIMNEEHPYFDAELKYWKALSEKMKHPAIQLFRLRFDFIDEMNLDKYDHLKRQMFLDFDKLNLKNQKTHLLSLINDTNHMVRQGMLDITALLDLYQLGLKTDLLLTQGKLTMHSYSSIVISSNTKGSFDFTHDFIASYSKLLDVELQVDSVAWARAHTAYWQGEKEHCLDILQHHEFTISYFSVVSKVLSLQAYFDLYLEDDSYFSYLFNYFDTFEKWLYREKNWSDRLKKSFLRFVQLSRYLARQYGTLVFKEEKVNDMLEGEHNVQALNWLKKKVEEVKMKRKLTNTKEKV